MIRSWRSALLLAAIVTAASVIVLDVDLRDTLSGAQLSAALERMARFASGFARPDLSPEALARCGRLALETLAVAVFGTALGAAAGLALGVLASDRVLGPGPAARAVVVPTRIVLDVLRAVPDFAWALAILLFIGPGPITGALAIAVTATGMLGRTYGQLLDDVPYADVRAAETTGGTRIAAAAYGRLPRIAAAAWSYSLVRLECSVRNASVIGIVGGGGLGAELFEELGYGRDDRVATLLLTLLLLTAGADIGAGWIRRQRAGHASPSVGRQRAAVLVPLGMFAAATAGLIPALADVASTVTGTDPRVLLDAARRLATPDLSPATLGVAVRSSAAPLATTWLATAGSAAIALALLPWTSAALARRAAGLRRPALVHWLPSLSLRAVALVARAVPDVAWLLLLAAAFRMGPAPAVLALGMHSCGVLVRVFTESVDDSAARDRARGPGTRTAWLAYRTLPATRGTLVTHVALQAESNLRAAVVLGIVGAGGLGDAFHTAVSFWRLERASTLILAMIVLFIALDRLARRISRAAVGRATGQV